MNLSLIIADHDGSALMHFDPECCELTLNARSPLVVQLLGSRADGFPRLTTPGGVTLLCAALIDAAVRDESVMADWDVSRIHDLAVRLANALRTAIR